MRVIVSVVRSGERGDCRAVDPPVTDQNYEHSYEGDLRDVLALQKG